MVVAGLSAWHPDHDIARPVLASRPRIVGHVLAEAYAVLTRLPHAQRLAPATVMGALRAAFPALPVVLAPRAVRPLLERLSAAGIGGGATYDALVAETARTNGLELVTLDRRASVTYEAVGIVAAFIG